MMNRFFTAAACSLLFMFSLLPGGLQAAQSSLPSQASNTATEKITGISKPAKPVGHRKEISVFVLSTDGRYALTGDEDENNFLWDLKTGTLIRTVGKPEAVRLEVVAAGFSPDASTLLWARYRKHMPVLWDVKSGRRLGVLSSKDQGHLAEIVSLAFSGDGQYVATGDVQGTIVLWNMKDRTPVRKFKAHAGRVGTLAFIPGRPEFVSAGDDGAVKLWVVERSPEFMLKEPGPGVTALAVSADGSVIYAASSDGSVRAWNAALRNLRGTLMFDNRQIDGIAVSPTGDFIALAQEDESILVWNIHKSKLVWKKKLDDSALQVTFSPDGMSLFTSGGDNWVREWESSSGRLIRKFAGVGE